MLTCLSACLSAPPPSLPVCLFVCLSVCMSGCLAIGFPAYLSARLFCLACPSPPGLSVCIFAFLPAYRSTDLVTSDATIEGRAADCFWIDRRLRDVNICFFPPFFSIFFRRRCFVFRAEVLAGFTYVQLFLTIGGTLY